jgi:cytochrome c553
MFGESQTFETNTSALHAGRIMMVVRDFNARNLFWVVLCTCAIALLLPAIALAQSACVEQGALAYENWTKTDAGGTGALPDGVVEKDYIRCKACHGWDKRGTDGGYNRRSRKDTRPNAGFRDSDQTSRDISLAKRNNAPVTSDMIWHAGTGRAYTDGFGSWVPLGGMHSHGNKAAHAQGFTLGNQHPDFTLGGMTQEQVDCLAEFLNFADAADTAYFTNIQPGLNAPVQYTIRADADAAAGETYYNAVCVGCHGDPATDHQGANNGVPSGGILAYLSADGKFSEFSHKVRWGIPNEIMTRSTMGNPSALDVSNIMLWLQGQLGGAGFNMTGGFAGAWWNSLFVGGLGGEGFFFDGAVTTTDPDNTQLVVSYFTYDLLGNQIYMVGAGVITGNTATAEVVLTNGATFGTAFDPDDVVRTVFGTIAVTGFGCNAGHVVVTPNQTFLDAGYEVVSYDIERLAQFGGPSCP